MAVGRQRSALTTMNDAGGGCPISADTPREEAKPERMEGWGSGDHRSGLGSGGGDWRREIRRRRRGREAAEGARGIKCGGCGSFFLFLAIGEARGNDVQAGSVEPPDGSISENLKN
jgi:hypothetical protein